MNMLAREMPASFVAFDLLALDERDLRQAPFFQRRAELEIGPRRLSKRPCTSRR